VAKPDGLLLVEPEREIEFLHPLPVEKLWGVGVKTADKLHARGITTVGEVAQLPETVLVGMLGRASGRQLHALSNGRDPRRVTVGVRRRSIGGQRAIGRRGQPKAPEYLDEVLVGLIDRITRRLRAARRVARTVILRLRFDDFSRATRSHTIAEASAESRVLLGAARELMEAALPTIRARGCTLVGLSFTNLEDIDAVQLALPVDRTRTLALDAAVDEVRDRFGTTLLTRGVLLGRDSGIEMPMLPKD
jgi:DNA polymerase-4